MRKDLVFLLRYLMTIVVSQPEPHPIPYPSMSPHFNLKTGSHLFLDQGALALLHFGW